MTHPLVSIIIPTFNREDVLPRAIDSVIKQHYGPWELIIVDDGSIDNTAEVVDQFIRQSFPIRYIKTDHDGTSAARNVGIKAASGQYIAFLDSDDTFSPSKLKVLIPWMQLRNAKLCLSNGYKVTPKNRQLFNKITQKEKLETSDIVSGKYPPSCSLLVTEKILAEKILFDEDLLTSNDFDFVLRAMTITDCYYYSNPLAQIIRTLRGNRISTDLHAKSSGYKIVRGKCRSRVYQISKYEKRMLLQRTYLLEGMIEIISGSNTLGRQKIKLGLKASKTLHFYIFKILILYIISYSEKMLKISRWVSEKMWNRGMIINA